MKKIKNISIYDSLDKGKTVTMYETIAEVERAIDAVKSDASAFRSHARSQLQYRDRIIGVVKGNDWTPSYPRFVKVDPEDGGYEIIGGGPTYVDEPVEKVKILKRKW